MAIENGPVEIVDLPIDSMVDLSIIILISHYQRVEHVYHTRFRLLTSVTSRKMAGEFPDRKKKGSLIRRDVNEQHPVSTTKERSNEKEGNVMNNDFNPLIQGREARLGVGRWLFFCAISRDSSTKGPACAAAFWDVTEGTR